MRYINTNTLEETTLDAIKASNMNVSFPEGFPELPDFGYAVIHEVVAPTYDAITEGRREITPVQSIDDGLWYQTWEVYALDQNIVDANILAANTALRASIVAEVMNRLDTFAATRNYSNIFSACTYVTSTVPKFQKEAVCCVALRDATWTRCYSILAEIEANLRPMPTGYSDIEADLPILEWPPTADFSASAVAGNAPLTVNFTSITTYPGTYAWDFTNDATVDATTQDAEFTYETPGIYTVRLVVTNSVGTDEEVKTDYILVW